MLRAGRGGARSASCVLAVKPTTLCFFFILCFDSAALRRYKRLTSQYPSSRSKWHSVYSVSYQNVRRFMRCVKVTTDAQTVCRHVGPPRVDSVEKGDKIWGMEILCGAFSVSTSACTRPCREASAAGDGGRRCPLLAPCRQVQRLSGQLSLVSDFKLQMSLASVLCWTCTPSAISHQVWHHYRTKVHLQIITFTNAD